MEEEGGWRVHLSSSEATASEYEEVSLKTDRMGAFKINTGLFGNILKLTLE